MKSYTEEALSAGTKKTYNQGVKAYRKFQSYINEDQSNAPHPDHDRIVLFIAYLAYNKKLSYRCVRTYVYSVRNWVLQNGGPDPTKPRSHRKRHQLEQLLAGVKRANRAKRNVKKALKLREVTKLVRRLNITNVMNHTCKIMFKAALLLAFFGFLRCSEYTRTSLNRGFCLRRKDVKVNNDHIKVTLRKTKSNQFSSSIVRIYGNGTEICPLSAMNEYLNSRNLKKSSPLFWKGSSPLTYSSFNAILKQLLTAVGLNPSQYSSHSLRSGAATTAANRGIPSWLIQNLGRWHSDCYKIYVKNPVNAIRKAQLSMSK